MSPEAAPNLIAGADGSAGAVGAISMSLIVLPCVARLLVQSAAGVASVIVPRTLA